MKKLFAFISVLLVASMVFADVTAKKLPDGKIEATFFYGNPRATEVLLAGDFTNWQNGALPMTKGEKGFSLAVTLPADTEAVTYKFISDGNWTTDLRAPLFIDDGFGGKNSKAEIADLIGGSDDSADRAKIVYSTWTMLGTQGQFATGKGDDAYFDNMTIAAKSYNKFGGTFIPNAPFYIELALAENELESTRWDAWALTDGGGLTRTAPSWIDENNKSEWWNGGLGGGNGGEGSKKNHYLYKQNNLSHNGVAFDDGLKDAFNGILTNLPAYFGFATTNEGGSAGPGSNPFLGHLKFGWNTPYVNFLTGFNYAKPDTQKTILWTTVDGGWDAGYDHIGGFNVFSLGEKLTHVGDATVNFTFAPNKSADRHGSKYGLWTFANVSYDKFVAEVQYNGYYLGDGLFYKPFEQDIIFGAKNKFGDNLTIAAQMAFTLYDNYDEAVAERDANYNKDTDYLSWANMRGYASSAIAFADEGSFDFIKHTAGEVKVSYDSDILNISADYRYRGAEQNLLFVTDHHKTGGKSTQSDQLGKINSQRITLDATVKPTDALTINVVPYFETVLSTDDWKLYHDALAGMSGSFYCNRNRNAFHSEDGKRFAISEKVDFDMSDIIGKSSAVSLVSNQEFVTEDEDKFAGYDSKALMNNFGVKFSLGDLGDTLQGIDIYYGLNNDNDYMMFNTLIGSLNFKGNTRVDAFVGIRSLTPEFDDADLNHPVGFGVGVSKQLKRAKKPTVYAQFVYDMDPYNEFGDGQDQLNLSNYGAGDHYVYAGDGDTVKCDSVYYYYGAAAVRMGIRWSF